MRPVLVALLVGCLLVADPSLAEEDLPLPEETAVPPFLLKDDPCREWEEAIEERKAFLRRVAGERDAFAWVESSEDAHALRLLQSLRRCVEHPDDEDCKPPPIEVRLEEAEPPRHQFERWPGDLSAEGKEPDQVPHDPRVLHLLQQLEACRRKVSPQPLLDRR